MGTTCQQPHRRAQVEAPTLTLSPLGRLRGKYLDRPNTQSLTSHQLRVDPDKGRFRAFLIAALKLRAPRQARRRAMVEQPAAATHSVDRSDGNGPRGQANSATWISRLVISRHGRGLAAGLPRVYITCMALKTATTVRLDPADVEALARARADGFSTSELIRRGIRTVAAKYYRHKRRPPVTALFVSEDPRLGDEGELFATLEESSSAPSGKRGGARGGKARR